MRPVHEIVFDEILASLKVHAPTMPPQTMVVVASDAALKVKERIEGIGPAEWASWRKPK